MYLYTHLTKRIYIGWWFHHSCDPFLYKYSLICVSCYNSYRMYYFTEQISVMTVSGRRRQKLMSFHNCSLSVSIHCPTMGINNLSCYPCVKQCFTFLGIDSWVSNVSKLFTVYTHQRDVTPTRMTLAHSPPTRPCKSAFSQNRILHYLHELLATTSLEAAALMNTLEDLAD